MKFTATQLKIVLRENGIKTSTIIDEAYTSFLIPIHGPGEHRAAKKMVEQDMGIFTCQAPFNNTFFRPRWETYQAARDHKYAHFFQRF